MYPQGRLNHRCHHIANTWLCQQRNHDDDNQEKRSCPRLQAEADAAFAGTNDQDGFIVWRLRFQAFGEGVPVIPAKTVSAGHIVVIYAVVALRVVLLVSFVVAAALAPFPSPTPSLQTPKPFRPPTP